jgi:2-oxoglutarate ferredoxin oxidoreductase subunit gamma
VLAQPFTRIATDLGNRIVTNVVLLGYLVGVTGVVSPDAVEQAIRGTVKEKALDLNLRAFDAGMSLTDESSQVKQ